MAKVTPKLEIVIDLERPYEEILACIAEIIKPHQGKQLEILQKVDLWLGETISAVESEIANQKSKIEKIPEVGKGERNAAR
ncbi:MAG: hypothetical protein K0Q73_8302 [Paenibacillus sp.]|jgi:hypothetical protein|nr:hypothetical protein [Paenibacillus sp.]